jgi:hypothetical protein
MFGNAAKGIAEVQKDGKLTLPLEMDLFAVAAPNCLKSTPPDEPVGCSGAFDQPVFLETTPNG